MLEIKNISVTAGDKIIINQFNLNIKDGEIHALMGPNGTGKSTICKALMKSPDYEITKGSILYNNIDITKLDTSEISRLGVFYISQSPIAIEGVTNAEMLRMALNERFDKKINIFEFNKKCNEICDAISLPRSFLHRDINVGMSGGERKKQELLHLWMLEPNLILLDEIDSGLDVDALKMVTASIMEYYKEKHPSILIITHQTKILDTIKPNVVHILKDGRIIHSGEENLAKKIEKEGFQSIFEAYQLSEGKDYE